MEKHPETLEDLLCYLEGSREIVLAIQCAMNGGGIAESMALSALFGVYNHLDFIAKEMMKHIERIPADVLTRVGEEVAKQPT